jgi:hypothetical protein
VNPVSSLVRLGFRRSDDRRSPRPWARPARVLLAVLLVPFATVVAQPAAQAAPDPLSCTGYPEWRTFIEGQSWWVDSQNPFPGQHVHLGTCFPLHQTVSGKVHFDLRVMAHNVPGAIKKIAVQVFGNGSIQSKAVDLNCTTVDCTWWVPFDLDTTKMSYNGRWEFRLRAIIPNTPNGNQQYNSTRWHATINNPGKPWKDTSNPISRSPGGAGWYTGIGYMNVYCGPDGYDFVRRPLSGVVKLTCRFDKDTAFASIDGNFHAGNPGQVVLNSTGGSKTMTIDTTQLANGKHRLFLRTDRKIASGTGSGAQALTFEVQN